MKATFKVSKEQNEKGLYEAHLEDPTGRVVCSAGFTHDSAGNTVLIDLSTPVEFRGCGYARTLLGDLRREETACRFRVVSTEHAVGFYRKLGYKEIAPYIFEAAAL